MLNASVGLLPTVFALPRQWCDTCPGCKRPPVGEVKGGSSGEAKVQPVCSSLGLSGFVRCQVGCVIDTPMAS